MDVGPEGGELSVLEQHQYQTHEDQRTPRGACSAPVPGRTVAVPTVWVGRRRVRSGAVECALSLFRSPVTSMMVATI